MPVTDPIQAIPEAPDWGRHRVDILAVDPPLPFAGQITLGINPRGYHYANVRFRAIAGVMGNITAVVAFYDETTGTWWQSDQTFSVDLSATGASNPSAFWMGIPVWGNRFYIVMTAFDGLIGPNISIDVNLFNPQSHLR